MVLTNPTFTPFIFHQPRAARDQESYQSFLPSPPSPSLPKIATCEFRYPRRTQPRDRREFFLQLPPRILERMNLDHLTLKYFSFSPLDVAVDAGLAARVNPSIPYSQIPKPDVRPRSQAPPQLAILIQLSSLPLPSFKSSVDANSLVMNPENFASARHGWTPAWVWVRYCGFRTRVQLPDSRVKLGEKHEFRSFHVHELQAPTYSSLGFVCQRLGGQIATRAFKSKLTPKPRHEPPLSPGSFTRTGQLTSAPSLTG